MNHPQPALHDGPQDAEVIRTPPFALGPEKCVLSCMMQDPSRFVLQAIEAGLSAESFYLPGHQILFREVIAMEDAGRAPELPALVQWLLDRGQLDRVGGPAAVYDVFSYHPSLTSFPHYAATLAEKALARGLITAANETIAEAYDAPDEAAELLDRAEARLTALRGSQARDASLTTKQAVDRVILELQDLMEGTGGLAKGIPTGIEGLDRLSFGMRGGEIFVIAARPSMGKTSFMMNIVEHACIDHGVPSMVFSCEMTQHQIIQRLTFSRARFDIGKIKRGEKADRGDLMRIQRCVMDVSGSGLIIDDTAAISISSLRAKARRHHRERGIGLIAVDYLQLMRSHSKQAIGSREREIAEISAGLKGLAKELNVPIIVLAQLNRASESRTGKTKGVPRMSDLRESGAIEQDADQIGLLFRDDYFADTDQEKAACAGRARLILAKNRSGGTGDVWLKWTGELMRFEDGEPYEAQDHEENKPRKRFGN